MRKLIGLTGPSAFTEQCQDTIEHLLEANFVLLYQTETDNIKEWLTRLDGVIISGGIDIHPTVYQQSIWNNQNLSKFDLKRDVRELAIIEYCLQNKLPLFGICRGHQLIGIRMGLDFVMDLTDAPTCHNPHKSGVSISIGEPTHFIKFPSDEAKATFYNQYKMPELPEERQVLKQIMGEKLKEKLWVNSFHHQAIPHSTKITYKDRGIDVLGIAAVGIKDCCDNCIELMQGDRWISVQFHPEFDWRENTVSRVVLERFKEILNEEPGEVVNG
jgi:putative glutamine amidotransferase